MSDSRPNVLWIMTDQHRADCLGCLGNAQVQTPNLDRLAAMGIVFENAFCQSPVCMASRGSVITGRYPAAIPIRGMGILPPRETTTPELFQRHGWRTGAFGKLHLTPELYTRQVLQSEVPILDLEAYAADACLGPIPTDPYKKNYGFQEHVGCDDSLKGEFLTWLGEVQPELLDREPTRVAGGPGDCFVSPYPSEYHPSTFIGRQAEAFVRRQEGSEPWLAFCSFIAPHHPFEAPADQIARYDAASLTLPEVEEFRYPELIPEPARQAIGGTTGWTEEGLRRTILHYYASISLIDDNVGRLLTALEETGQLENTIILFNADHGEFLGRHGLIRKPSLHYDEVLRVPCLLRLPGNEQAGRRVKGLVELVDLHPTLLSLAGLPVNAGVQGRDWSAALHDGAEIGRDAICSDMYDDPIKPETCLIAKGGPYMAVQTLRTESWKLSIYPTAGPQFGQLFDLANDPEERENRYADPTCREIRGEMLWRLAARLAANVDPLPLVLSQW